MYFEDLHIEEAHYGVKFVKVAWLDKGKPYAKGKCPPEFIEKLKKQNPKIRTKGWHDCPFCGNAKSSNQFHFQKKGKTFYDVPQMIIHYIEEHDYMPPQELIDCVMGLEDEAPIQFHRVRHRQIRNFK